MQDLPGPQIGFREVASLLRDQITNGAFPPGADLPSGADLASNFGCGVDTIRDALTALKHEGFITKGRTGRLTARLHPEHTLVALPPGTIITARPMTMPEAEHLGCGPGIAVFQVQTKTDKMLYRGDLYALTGNAETAGHPYGTAD